MSTPSNALNISSPGIVVFNGTNSFAEITPAASSVLVTSAGSVPSLAQTLPSAVQGNITSVGTIASGSWNGSLISGTYGGTGVNNGASTITIPGNFSLSGGAYSFSGTLSGNTSVTFPTSGTLATSGDIPSLPLSLANGGTAANLTASNGGIFYSTGSAGAILAGTPTANQVLLSGASAAPVWSTATYPATATGTGTILRADGTNWVATTATYPATTTVNQLLYSSATNVVGEITAVIDGVLISDHATGAPSWLANGTAGQVLTANTGAPPSWQSAGGGGITTINGSSGSVTGATITWSPGTTGLTYTGAASTMTVAGTLVLANGGSGASLTASTGGIVYSGASAMAILSGTATANKVLMSGSSAAPVWSTPTFPNASATSGKIIISDGTNWIASTPTYPAAAGTSGNVLTSDGTNWTSSTPATKIGTLNGDSGSATGATVTITTTNSTFQCGSSVKFTGSGSTLALSVQDSGNNIFFGKTVGNTTLTGAGNCVMSGVNGSAAPCLNITSGGDNAGVGVGIYRSLTSGEGNCAFGSSALATITTGIFNLGIGLVAGQAYTSSESHNILLNPYTSAVVGESNVLRIGSGTGTSTCNLNKSFIHGIRGITTVNNDAVAVLIDSAGQLGTVSSSARFKEDIVDMGDRSSDIMKLRPVQFKFKETGREGLGLIAEEVAVDFPYLVANDSEGIPASVKYHELPALLLNEIKKLQARIEALEARG